MRGDQRRAIQGLAATAAGIGLGAIFLAGMGARTLGLDASPGALWSIRLFGVRELCLAYGLARARSAKDPGQARLMADLVTVAQIGDGILAGVLLARGTVSRRFALVVWAGLAPTVLASRRAAGRR